VNPPNYLHSTLSLANTFKENTFGHATVNLYDCWCGIVGT
jgi:hypothetical protein